MALNTFNEYEAKELTASENAIAPHLFIGLGGQGCRMVAELAHMAETQQSAAKYLSFVAIDTDVNELRGLNKISENIIQIQTSSRMTIGEYLDYDTNARNNWFPMNDIILDKTPSEGAGQIRAISNLVAHNAIREGSFKAIDDAIERLFPLSQDDFEQAIHVTIMGTLAGGTGSGLFLSVALYVKYYLTEVLQQKSSVVRGFFLLPDVMSSVIENHVEFDNQQSNAYASIREIDAFMRYPYDEKLQERYPNLKVIVPRVGGAGYDEFCNSPFTFCFLFNKITVRGSNIEQKDNLLMHAVKCIYDMSISPISKAINSQEDNIIREKISSGNKASYAGAGCSRLIYPYKDVVEYVALNWAGQSMKKDWLDADKEVVDKKKKDAAAQNSGKAVVEQSEEDIFMNYFNSKRDTSPSVAAVLSQTEFKPEKQTTTKPISDKYLKDLDAFIIAQRAKLSKNSKAVTYREEAVELSNHSVLRNEIMATLQNSEAENRAREADEAIDQYFLCYDESVNDAKIQMDYIASGVIDAVYEETKDSKDEKIPVIEEYLHIKRGQQFVHPNAARYILMDICKQLENRLKLIDDDLNHMREDIENFAKELGDLQKENETAAKSNAAKQAIENATGKKVPFKPSPRCLDINDIITALLLGSDDLDSEDSTENALLDDYCNTLINKHVYTQIKEYFGKILEGFKEFFRKLSADVSGIGARLEKIERQYTNDETLLEGITADRYVCTSSECLRSITANCSNAVGTYDLPSELTRGIFNTCKNYAVMYKNGTLAEKFGIEDGVNVNRREAGINAFFGKVFDQQIMDFWRTMVVKNYDNVLNMDIIQAIYKEAQVDGLCVEPEQQRSYLYHRLQKAQNLAIPFIDAPRGTQRRELNALAANSSIKKTLGAEFEIFRKEYIKGFRLCDSSDYSRYELAFYRSIYNIAAKNLVKMLPMTRKSVSSSVVKRRNKFSVTPGRTGATSRFDGSGSYFRVYHDRVSNIEPLDSENKEITPHLQKDWHYLNVLPELDDEFQKLEEIRIAKAFVYALISGKIGYRKHDKNGYNFCYEIVDSTIRSPQLIVSNGTNCDQFYEMLDALTLCPRYVDRLLDLYIDDVNNEKSLGNDFQSTAFYQKYSGGFAVEEFTSEPFLNILDIPLLYKASAGTNYIPAWGEAILSATFEIINELLVVLEEKNVIDDERGEFLIKIFDNFVSNLDKLQSLSEGDPNSTIVRKHSRLKRIKSDTVTLSIFDKIAEILESQDEKFAHSEQYAAKIKDIYQMRRELSLQ